MGSDRDGHQFAGWLAGNWGELASIRFPALVEWVEKTYQINLDELDCIKQQSFLARLREENEIAWLQYVELGIGRKNDDFCELIVDLETAVAAYFEFDQYCRRKRAAEEEAYWCAQNDDDDDDYYRDDRW